MFMNTPSTKRRLPHDIHLLDARKPSDYLYITSQTSMGEVKGGKSCRFYAADGDVIFLTFDA